MSLDLEDLKPGDEVDAWCGKCKDMKLHKVKALVPGKDPRVICEVCSSEHNYRTQPSQAQATTTSRPRAKRTKVEEHNPWQELVGNVAGLENKLKTYSISNGYEQGDFIDHQRYGRGYVMEVLDTSKMVVAFQDKKRIMVCNK